MTDWPTWDQLKQGGSEHYKTGAVEPIDLYRSATPHKSLSSLMIFALCCIIKYAFRCLTRGVSEGDMGKIVHYARIVMANHKEQGKA